MHILHSLPAALIRRGNIDPVHRIMQHSGRQFLQIRVLLYPENKLLNTVSFFLLSGNLLPPELHFLRQLCLLIFIVGGQLFKSAIIDFAGDIVLIEPFEQTVKLFHPALCLHELSALCGEFFLEILPTLCTQLIAEQILTIGDIPKQDLQKFQHVLLQNNRADEVRPAHVFSLLARGRADEMILSFFKVPRGAVVHFFSAIGTVGNAGKEVALASSCRSAFVAAQLLYPLKGVLIHNGFVGVAEYLPLLRWILDGLLDFVGLPVRFEVHGMPAILHPFQNCSNGTAVPVVRTILPSGFPARTQTPFAMQSLREEFGEKFSQVFKTITVDNGSEFSAFSQVESWGCAVYFAHPYTSWERPQNERHNGLFRAFVPKGVSIESFSAEYILAAADELNGRPRKKLGYRTPEELFDKFPTLFTQPKAAAASPRTEASGFHPDRRSGSLSSTVQVSNLHLQFAS